jgi:CheY-like chemotaxis protein
MKIELRCSGCGKGYLVDESALGSGLPCPGCSEPLGATTQTASTPDRPNVTNRVASNAAPAIAVDRPAPAIAPVTEPTQAAPEPAAPTPTPMPAAAPVAAAPTTPAVAPAAEASPAVAVAAAITEEVVCPRCELHFAPRTTASVAREAARKRKKVLIVEDMEYFREIAAEALMPEYEVKGVATTDDALSVLSQGDVDLMVLDLTLDGGDGGLDLLKQLSTKPCPILIYTAQDESEMYGDSWEELRGYGADDIVIKGMNVGDQLVRKVGTLLGKDWDSDD